jgi:hypothetical protein
MIRRQIIASYLLVKIVLLIKSDTSFPEINAGGTPGPGTVNCPVKYKLHLFYFLVLVLKKPFAIKY